jgi:CelD/BcsL family acetyltransferase involved in cellulose biosynthesis
MKVQLPTTTAKFLPSSMTSDNQHGQMELHFSPNIAMSYEGLGESVLRHEAGMTQDHRPYVFKLAGAHFDSIEVHHGEDACVTGLYGSQLNTSIGTPFQKKNWLESWHRHVGAPGGFTPVLVVCLRDQQPVLVLPLCLARHRGLRKLSWMGQNLDDYCGPVGDAAALQALTEQQVYDIFKRTAALLGGVDVVCLFKQRASYGDVKNPFVSPDSIAYHAASHRTVLSAPWDGYFAKKRSAKSRGRLRNKLGALVKAGKLEMKFAADAEEAAKLVSLGLAMKATQLGQRGHHNPFASMEAQRHLINVFSQQCRHGTWTAALTLDDKPLAISFGFKDDNSWLLYQIAMQSTAHDNLSPGTHLIMFIMKQCCDLNVSEFDFSLGDEAYKLEWCEISEKLFSSFIPLTLRGHFAAVAMRLSAHARNVVASNEKLYEFGKSAKQKINHRFGNAPQA